MELSYETLELRDICEIKEKAVMTFGIENAHALRKRLADIYAIDRITDLPVGLPNLEDFKAKDHIMINLYNGTKMKVVANHRNNPKDDFGFIDWNRVSRVKIVGIGGIYDSQ